MVIVLLYYIQIEVEKIVEIADIVKAINVKQSADYQIRSYLQT